jgi:rRNA maturation endonuclease Nob1
MKIDGVKREWNNPLFVYRKHFCPKCGAKLRVTKNARVVDSASSEAKNYDFSSGDGFMVGKIKFIRTEFRCGACKRTYSVDEVRQRGL